MEEQERYKAEEAPEPTEASSESGPKELSEKDLEKVAGGAKPIIINSQMTD